MTRAEAEALLLAAYPAQCVWVECERKCSFYELGTPRSWQTQYCVSVVPGNGGEKCSRWEGGDLEEVVRLAAADRVPREMADAFFHPPELVRCDVCCGDFPPDQIGQSTVDAVLCRGCLAKAPLAG